MSGWLNSQKQECTGNAASNAWGQGVISVSIKMERCLMVLPAQSYLAEGEREVSTLFAASELQAGHHLAGTDGKGRDCKGDKEGGDA